MGHGNLAKIHVAQIEKIRMTCAKQRSSPLLLARTTPALPSASFSTLSGLGDDPSKDQLHTLLGQLP